MSDLHSLVDGLGNSEIIGRDDQDFQNRTPRLLDPPSGPLADRPGRTGRLDIAEQRRRAYPTRPGTPASTDL
ncbi:hypothetical protein [Faunimonas pinastri]|uniref:hypothetical protein n=1 Tax=Faunimonas pinastri TaxID=1855383 RepID=UPI00115FA2D5|nr:hypothetical protein [Faunimonas pinastri]